MKNPRYILILFTFLTLAGCGSDPGTGPADGNASIRLRGDGFSRTRVVDADNLAVEQTVNDISVLMTDPGSLTVTGSYIHVGFTTVDDYRLVTIPDDGATLATKDIYVVANYTVTDLSAITSIDQLRELTTPVVDKANNLDPAKGFCMYGMTAGFDFTTGAVADVYVRRACAKIRVTMTFPNSPGLSTQNEFLIANAAQYAWLTDHTTALILPVTDYFNFAANLPLSDDGAGGYTGIAYVYEASAHPVLYLYTHIGGSADPQEYSAELPLPERNHLYDCDVRIFTEEDPDGGTRSTGKGSYRIETTVTEYGPEGQATIYETASVRR